MRCAASPSFSRLLTEFRLGFQVQCSSSALLLSSFLVDSLGRSAGFDPSGMRNHSERLHLDEKSATRSDGTGDVATVRCRCGRSQLRESAACSQDNVRLSARKRAREGIGSHPILHPMRGTASRTNVSDHEVPSRTALHSSCPTWSLAARMTPSMRSRTPACMCLRLIPKQRRRSSPAERKLRRQQVGQGISLEVTP